MQTRTICCKLLTTPEFAQALALTSVRFAEVADYILQHAIQHKTSNALKLHQLCYKEARNQFNLSANLTIRAIRRVAAMLTRLKGKRKAPKRFKPKSIDYDARVFYYQPEGDIVSLKTVTGRFKIPMLLGQFQREALVGKKPSSATVLCKAGVWYIHMVIEVEPSFCEGTATMGIDLGIKKIATSSTSLQISGEGRQAFKSKCAKTRASLQSKQTQGAKKVLKKNSGKEQRRIRHENHVLSKQLVEEAKRHNCGIIRMEQLKAIRERTRTWNKHLNRMVAGWSFFQLQKFVVYKASLVGISVEFVDPSYTSQTCHQCLQLGSRKGERFNCLACGDCDADYNAACVISLGGAACKPARISSMR